MEAKKNPGQDVHQQSFKFFLIGLGISVSLAITAFEWRTEKIDYPNTVFELPIENTIEVMATLSDPPTSAPNVEKKIPTLFHSLTATSLPENIVDDKPEIEFSQEDDYSDQNAGSVFYDLPKEDTTQIVTLAEFQPQPIGGYELFYAQLSQHLKYPQKAIRNGVDGKVYIEFIVNRNGKTSQMKILKGIGSGCDEEAMRVLSIINWEPGKQRGRPVNVRMVMPVIFKVN